MSHVSPAARTDEAGALRSPEADRIASSYWYPELARHVGFYNRRAPRAFAIETELPLLTMRAPVDSTLRTILVEAGFQDGPDGRLVLDLSAGSRRPVHQYQRLHALATGLAFAAESLEAIPIAA
ncbi:hypothetical protein LAZ40_04480 [Cereibacter sphaeroides]|uniref:hypothetical protein n=1 Tax=Cereibacter sphaeroides TaxID=1063 RepID=UPI001F209FCD|nr:hypothetical protein [Cereibacter sphaeroides]MCE6958312.1 hypothetical protein [Cereibacter sphaeroides]MCE6971922.1 hypothetical protein [Cereibacter sphaeroides]